MGPCAIEENLLAQAIHRSLGRVGLLGSDRGAFRFCGQPGHEGFHLCTEIPSQ